MNSNQRELWSMRTGRIVRLIQAEAPDYMVMNECRLIIRAFGWLKFVKLIVSNEFSNWVVDLRHGQ